MAVWVEDGDGKAPTQRTRNAAHDERPAWSPDGRLLAYTSGPDSTHGDIHVMTVDERELRRLTSFAGRDESPDWQAIRTPPTGARCGDSAKTGRGAYDVRRGGRGLSCAQACALARRRVHAGQPGRVRGYVATRTDLGGTSGAQLRTGGRPRRPLGAFLYKRGR